MVSTLLVNQGVYNGVITILMSSILLMALVVDTLTSNWKIIFTQGTLAFVTLVLSVVHHFVA